MNRGFSICTILVVCGLAAPASARPGSDTISEFMIGMASPIGDDGYEDIVDPSLLVGARLGTQIMGDRRSGLALEVSIAWQPLNLPDIPLVDEGFSTRIRASGGARLYMDIDRGLRIFGRFGVGIDYVNVSAEDAIIGVDLSIDDTGVLFEPGGGVLFDMGAASVGLQIAVPVAVHDADDDEFFDLDYTSRDVDVLLTIGGSF